jgi:hypothetical protein
MNCTLLSFGFNWFRICGVDIDVSYGHTLTSYNKYASTTVHHVIFCEG